MTKVATTITPKQKVVTPILQSCKTQKFGSNLPVDGINQTAFLPNLKLKPFAIFNIRKTLPCELDEFQTYIHPIFQPFNEEDNEHDSSDSSQHFQGIQFSRMLKVNHLTLLS